MAHKSSNANMDSEKTIRIAVHRLPNKDSTGLVTDHNGSKAEKKRHADTMRVFRKTFWTSPTSMLLFLLIGALLALAHHLFYQSLDGTLVTSTSQQALAIGIGTGVAYTTKTALGAVVIIAFTQHLWTSLRKKDRAIHSIDSMFSLATDALSFFDRASIGGAKILTLIALVSWFLPLITTFTPATISVHTLTSKAVSPMAVPSLNFSNTNDLNWGSGADAAGFGGPLPLISRLMSATSSSVGILPLTAPFPNSSFTLTFHAPSFKCESLASAIARNQGELFQMPLTFNDSVTAVPSNESTATTSATISAPSLSASASSLTGSAEFTTALTSDSNVAFLSDTDTAASSSELAFASGAATTVSSTALAFASGAGNSSTSESLAFASGAAASSTPIPSVFARDVSASTTTLSGNAPAFASATESLTAAPTIQLTMGTFEDVWDAEVGQDVEASTVWAASAPGQLFNYLLINVGGKFGTTDTPGGTNISCQLQNTSYTVDFNFTDGIQSTSIRSLAYLPMQPWTLSSFSPTIQEQFAYQSYSTAFTNAFVGTVIWGATGDLFTNTSGNGGGSSPSVLNTGIAACADFKSASIVSGGLGAQLDFILPSSLCRNGTVARALEDLSHNFTLSLLTSSILAPHSTTVPVTATFPQNYYAYDFWTLWLAYGVGILATLTCAAVGRQAYHANGYGASSSFSSILLATRNPDLDDLARGHELGLPVRELDDTQLRFGLLCRKDGTAHAAFGLPGTVRRLKCGDRI